ncbi:nuclear transport factor 2 family protein [Microbulbifer sp. SA54]|uniref:nuclear transport factor 2 family protein n=1 Tax=Microbulbifer sp. SA54 TaxID=3401577 RepID=UPI003AAB97CD
MKGDAKSRVMGLVLFMAGLLLTGPALAAADAGEQKQQSAIAAQLDGFHQAAANADFEDYFKRFSKDGVFLGTDATERWDVDAFKAFTRPYFSQGKGWTYVPRNRTIVVHGDVAWFDELLDNEAYGECRGTGVLVREGGQWKIAQYNLHFPVPNALARSITKMIKDSRAE